MVHDMLTDADILYLSKNIQGAI
uniref:Uncharacterized protein n=1 Tax=Arundo donax TaxID=35708 RepID=A0A0A9AKA0_ARUDO